MKIVNYKKKKFSGTVFVKNEKVFIDTSNGTGFHKVLELMEPHIYMLTNFGLSLCYWSTAEDIRQDVCVLILEGMIKYNPDKGASLSTFLYQFVKNRLIDVSRKNDPLKGRCNYELQDICYNPINPVDKIDLIRRIQDWNEKWRRIMFRLYINNDKKSDVAKDEQMTPWGLTRAVRKKLEKARE